MTVNESVEPHTTGGRAGEIRPRRLRRYGRRPFAAPIRGAGPGVDRRRRRLTLMASAARRREAEATTGLMASSARWQWGQPPSRASPSVGSRSWCKASAAMKSGSCNPGWAARQGLRAFLAFPLVEDRRITGIFAIFDREVPTTEFVGQLQLLADVTASRVAELQSHEADAAAATTAARAAKTPSGDPQIVITRAELRQREKQNIEAALAETHGKVFGTRGAAALLGMRPTTLASRIKALKIR